MEGKTSWGSNPDQPESKLRLHPEKVKGQVLLLPGKEKTSEQWTFSLRNCLGRQGLGDFQWTEGDIPGWSLNEGGETGLA